MPRLFVAGRAQTMVKIYFFVLPSLPLLCRACTCIGRRCVRARRFALPIRRLASCSFCKPLQLALPAPLLPRQLLLLVLRQRCPAFCRSRITACGGARSLVRVNTTAGSHGRVRCNITGELPRFDIHFSVPNGGAHDNIVLVCGTRVVLDRLHAGGVSCLDTPVARLGNTPTFSMHTRSRRCPCTKTCSTTDTGVKHGCRCARCEVTRVATVAIARAVVPASRLV